MTKLTKVVESDLGTKKMSMSQRTVLFELKKREIIFTACSVKFCDDLGTCSPMFGDKCYN